MNSKHRRVSFLAGLFACLSLLTVLVAGCGKKDAETPPPSTGYYSGDFKTNKGSAPGKPTPKTKGGGQSDL